MKRHITPLLPAAALLLCIAGCSSDPAPVGPDNTADGTPTGNVRIAASPAAAVSATVRTRTGETVELPDSLLPAGGEFALRITGIASGAEEEGTLYDRSWERLADFDSPQMPRGDYEALVLFGDSLAEGSGAACFAGRERFTILARRTQTVNVAATLRNAAVHLRFGEWFTRYYAEAEMTLRTETGATFRFTPGSDAEKLIFVRAETKLYLGGRAVKAQNGAEVLFAETGIGTTAARTLHTIEVEAAGAGGSGLVIELDDTFARIDGETIELNPDVASTL